MAFEYNVTLLHRAIMAFLSQENLFSGNFDTQITTSHHNAVGSFNNFIQIMHTLLVFDLGDDQNITTLLTCQIMNE